MECVCPVCNGLATYILKCQGCGGQMENKGAIQDFYDAYSTYLAMDITQRIDNVGKEECVHLFTCNKCHYDKRATIQTLYI